MKMTNGCGFGTLYVVLLAVAIFFALAIGISANTAWAAGGYISDPIFESNGNMSFDDGKGSGWWNLTQYDGRATVSVGAYSTNRIIGLQKNITVDMNDPSMFYFNMSMRTLDNMAPTGRLNFNSFSSNGDNYLSLEARDILTPVWNGWDQGPIFRNEMQATFQASLSAAVQINSVNDSYGHWSEERYDGDGNLYFSRSGGEFYVYGYGKFDSTAVGQQMVDSGLAQFGAVPEPATMSLLGLGLAGLVMRRKK